MKVEKVTEGQIIDYTSGARLGFFCDGEKKIYTGITIITVRRWALRKCMYLFYEISTENNIYEWDGKRLPEGEQKKFLLII